MSLASVLSVVCALAIIGVILAVVINVNYITKQVEKGLEISVYLEENLKDEQKDAIEAKLKENTLVDTVTYKSKKEALESFKETLGEDAHLLFGYTEESSPLPDSFTVSLKNPEKIHEVYEYALKINGVKDAVYGEQTVEKLLQFNQFTNIISWAVFAILSLIAVFIIYNTIKITVFSRRTDISIMKYVGATNTYIRFPFIIEGATLGTIGAVIAIMFVRNLYYFVVGMIQSAIEYMPMGTTLAPAGSVMFKIGVIFIVYGILLGSVGSLFSIKKFLNV